MLTLTIELLNPKAKTILDSLEYAGLIAIGELGYSSLQRGYPCSDDFWQQKTIDELAKEQRISPISDLDCLFGCGKDLWETEREWNGYLESIQAGRKEQI